MAQKGKKRKLETGLIIVGASSDQRLEEREICRRLGPGNSSKGACKPNKKITAAFRLLPVHINYE
jgi:hypothetical protein